jgi:hypothetical protein
VFVTVDKVVECGANGVETHLAGDQWSVVDIALRDRAQGRAA